MFSYIWTYEEGYRTLGWHCICTVINTNWLSTDQIRTIWQLLMTSLEADSSHHLRLILSGREVELICTVSPKCSRLYISLKSLC